MFAPARGLPVDAQSAIVRTSPADGVVLGTTRSADGAPVALATVRLRAADDGRHLGTVRTNHDGAFRFEDVPRGPCIVELLVAPGRLRGVSKPFAVAGGQTTIAVRVPAPSPSPVGLFRHTGASVVAAATRLGITAVGSSGRPISPQ
jgi:hypothetical protein